MNFPILLGSHRAKPSEWARLPSAEGLLLRRVRRDAFVAVPESIWRETGIRRAAKPKQKSKLPQGAGLASKQ